MSMPSERSTEVSVDFVVAFLVASIIEHLNMSSTILELVQPAVTKMLYTKVAV